jgi:hypothetical protein
MDIKELEDLLRSHLENKAKINIKKDKIKSLEKLLEYQHSHSQQTHDDVIEELSLHAVTISDMPVDRPNNIRSTTERAALHYKDKHYYRNNYDIEEIKSRIGAVQAEIDVLEGLARQVEILISSLKYEERFIIENYYIEGLKWTQVETFYYDKFRQHRHIGSLQQKRDEALTKMLRMTE